jgi:hypothetical protein
MLSSDVAMHAIRLLGVDTANLMTQMAVYRATVEELLEMVERVDLRSWEPIMEDDDAPSVLGMKLPNEQHEAVLRIINLIDGLR